MVMEAKFSGMIDVLVAITVFGVLGITVACGLVLHLGKNYLYSLFDDLNIRG